MATWGRILLLALASATILGGCGGGDEIPQDDAEVFLLRLDEVERAFEDGRCDGARESAGLLLEQVGDGERSRLPADVDSDIRELLQEGAARLVHLVDTRCQPAEEPDPEPPPVEPAPPPVDPEPEPEPEEEEAPPDDDEDRDRGNRGPDDGARDQGGGQGSGNPGGGSGPDGADGGTRASG